MLAIGRALMTRPRVLLLDEPSLGLSPLLVQQIFEIIQDINAQGMTILLVEQNALQALSIANRGYVLQTGRVVLSGTSGELQPQRDRPQGLPRARTDAGPAGVPAVDDERQRRPSTRRRAGRRATVDPRRYYAVIGALVVVIAFLAVRPWDPAGVLDRARRHARGRLGRSPRRPAHRHATPSPDRGLTGLEEELQVTCG